jgi:hypothetical protein
MILEGLGPKKKVFDDLEPGDYFFEISEPSDKGWIMEFTDKDADGQDTEAKATYINWRLRVVQPEEMEGRNFFHMTMLSATEEKLAKAKRPYDPETFTYQFLGQIGVGMLQGGEVTILDDYLTDSQLDLNKTIGLRFWGSIRIVKRGPKGQEKEYTSLTKVWEDK